jgi:gas vesicle protein
MAVAKQKQPSKYRGGFLLGMVVGIAIGAAVAILFIPSFNQANPDVESEDVLRRGQARYEQLAMLMRERYGDAMALGQEAYARAKDELLTRYTRAKAGE